MKKGKKMKHELSDINPQKMDSQKWDMLLDLLEHPEKYSETQKDELLGDEEVNELYQQLIETRQSLDFAKSKELLRRRFSPFLSNGDTSKPTIQQIMAALHRRRLFLHVRQVR